MQPLFTPIFVRLRVPPFIIGILPRNENDIPGVSGTDLISASTQSLMFDCLVLIGGVMLMYVVFAFKLTAGFLDVICNGVASDVVHGVDSCLSEKMRWNEDAECFR